jgi:hypothetical protein
MHQLLLNAGVPTLGFSDHSLRIGAALTAFLNGISRQELKLLGRWKSDAVDIYTDERQELACVHRILLLNANSFTNLSGLKVTLYPAPKSNFPHRTTQLSLGL